jgi:hypothetical protein
LSEITFRTQKMRREGIADPSFDRCGHEQSHRGCYGSAYDQERDYEPSEEIHSSLLPRQYA